MRQDFQRGTALGAPWASQMLGGALQPTSLRLTAETVVAASRCKHQYLCAQKTDYCVNWGDSGGTLRDVALGTARPICMASTYLAQELDMLLRYLPPNPGSSKVVALRGHLHPALRIQ